jgi:hypothetical protein
MKNEKGQRKNLQNTTQKTKDRAKNRGSIQMARKANSCCSTCGTSHVTLVTVSLIRHE